MTIQAKTITLGYSDSEDRIWLRLVLFDELEAKFWLTRRLTKNLCQALVNVIEKNSHSQFPNFTNQEINQHLRKELFELNQTVWDPTPPPPQINKITTSPSIQLCQNINIDLGTNWQLKFSGSRGPEYSLILEPSRAPKFLLALLKQSQKANWQIDMNKTWLIQ